MTPRPGKVEVPISGEVVSRRPRTQRNGGDEVASGLAEVARLDGPAKLNWLCKAMPMVSKRKMQPAEFLEIIASPRFAANLDDAMPWGFQMVSMLLREADDFQPQQVQLLRQSDLWRRFADSDDERAVASNAPAAAAVAERGARLKAAEKSPSPTNSAKK